ncbi:dihydroneopterin aldolase [Mucilaginibacter robiniae]|uniref:7,8-dihydroneopterin aldolase n=1 Tax=Mucilaginibacter robiniae TaxID=2728022 RepID=A0A7L5E5G5_9SPHI|nr:dihydroneopterin aldolase [Mucilaginibacter robiniae]QJD97868.1 dihydroneopterin aldolase [Mucilaginibacter robiniae]
MIKVSLHGAEFFARHGYYPEEQILGNRFVVDIDAEFTPDDALHQDQLNNTINYEHLYLIAQQEMQVARQLLETVAQSIMDQLLAQFVYLEKLSVRVKKLNPPLGGVVAASSVTIIYQKPV